MLVIYRFEVLGLDAVIALRDFDSERLWYKSFRSVVRLSLCRHSLDVKISEYVWEKQARIFRVLLLSILHFWLIKYDISSPKTIKTCS